MKTLVIIPINCNCTFTSLSQTIFSGTSNKVFKLRKQGKSQEEESKVTHCTGLRRSNPCSAAKYYNLQLHNCFQGKLLQGTPRHFAGNRKN